MDIETAKAMLQLLLGKDWHLYPQFAQFLESSKYKVINKDQWCNILEFSRTINVDLSNYDIDGACKLTKFYIRNQCKLIQKNENYVAGPVLLDEFVEWLRQMRGQ